MFLLFLLGGCIPHSVESTEVGVRVANLGILARPGVVEEVYAPGATYFFPPVINSWFVYDVGLQNLSMKSNRSAGDLPGGEAVAFKTADGNDITVDVTVAWRVIPDKAPYLLQFTGPHTRAVEARLVRPVIRTVLRDVLNDLRSEQYYDAEVRFNYADQARRVCNHYLEPEGVTVDQVLLGEHQFNPAYEQVIKDKTVADQEAARLRSETEAAREQMRRELEVARGEVSQKIEEARGESSKRQLAADATFIQRQAEAEALLAEARARTEGLRAQAKALAGAGGRNMVKIKLAEALAGKPILFIPAAGGDLRTTNMNQLMQQLGLLSAAGQGVPSP